MAQRRIHPGEISWRALLASVGGASFLSEVARSASGVVMDIYNRPHQGSKLKDDGSPVTEADLASAAVIERLISSVCDVPIVCEEASAARIDPDGLFWLIDPLDGTKEFLARNGEFTINIALISGRRPVAGVISIPALNEVYTAIRGYGALVSRGGITSTVVNAPRDGELVAAVSRSHGSDSADRYLSACGVTRTVQCGSAIKFCRVAEGAADLYVRAGRTMEWDTAAGHCILEECGCKLVVADTGASLTYGKPDFANPSFIARRAGLEVPLL